MGGRVLVVDDDVAIREVLVDILEAEGYAVASASDGQEALQRLSSLTPCIVLLDLMMPVMDGFEVLAHLRADPATSALPVLVLTANRTGLPPGATSMLHKPFEISDMLAFVDDHCP
jgi:CheY-like chemotaxis protein